MAALRPTLALCAALALALIGAGPAIAVSPQKIYKDLADNGRLDGRYTRADIRRAFDLDQVVETDKSPPRVTRRPAAAALRPEARRSARRLPFTGLDLALLTVGGGPLLLIGIGLRRRLSPAPGQAGVVRS